MTDTIGTKIDHVCNEIERGLSIGAVIAVIGTGAGLIKALMGVAQTIFGLVGGIFTLSARCMDNTELNDYFWTHFKHGLGNIVAGTFEAIPLVGTVLSGIRVINSEKGIASTQIAIKTGHEDKFMPYDSLRERDLEIVSGVGDDVADARQLFSQKVAGALIRNPKLSFEERYALAEQAIEETLNPIGG